MDSMWLKYADMPKFDTPAKDIETDTLIIGAGMAGILCGYFLERAGKDYTIVEANRIACGITEHTTAKITSQHGLIYGKLIREFGHKKAKLYLEANEAAIKKYRALCHDADCDFEEKCAFVYSKDDRGKLLKEISDLKSIGCHAYYSSQTPLPLQTAGAVKFTTQAQFNPLRFISHIAKGLNIYENTEIKELKGFTAYTANHKIKAKNIIITTHFPFINKHGLYFLKMYQNRSYVIALEGAPDYGGMYIDEAEGGLSFRNYKDLLLLGGESHRTGKPSGAWDALENFAMHKIPGCRVRYRFAAQDCMTLDGIPYIGRYSKNTDGLYVATGFNKWGMTSSMVAASLLCDMICEKDNKYAEVFSPSRSILHPQLAVNAYEALCSWCCPTTKRCPHLGCALKWNKHEHTWDCPCHGSRFTEDGKLIDNPATGDLKK